MLNSLIYLALTKNYVGAYIVFFLFIAYLAVFCMLINL